jgi:hypothetical protein
MRSLGWNKRNARTFRDRMVHDKTATEKPHRFFWENNALNTPREAKLPKLAA